jgi:hypothetical protein
MTDNMSNRDKDTNREFDADEFLDWADRMAESEGVSTDKILDQVVSSRRTHLLILIITMMTILSTDNNHCQ